MSAFLDLITSMPTVLWTIPFAICTIFVLLALIGGFDGDGPDVDADVDVDVDGDIGVDGGDSFVGGILDSLAIGTVPMTIVVTSISGVGWLLSIILEWTVGALAREVVGGFLFGSGSFLIALFGAVYATTWVVKPLKKVFVVHTQHSGKHLVGRIATVSSSKVTPTFGTAVIKAPDGSGDIILNVKSIIDHPYVRDDEVVITDYDEQTNLYTIAPVASSSAARAQEALATAEAQAADPAVAKAPLSSPDQSRSQPRPDAEV